MQKPYKPLLFSASLIPLAVLIYNGTNDNLTANPIEYITHYTGDWTIYFLLITISIMILTIHVFFFVDGIKALEKKIH